MTARRTAMTGPAVVLVVVLGAVLAGCGGPGGGAAAGDGGTCAAVLPLARDVVHGQGRPVTIRPVRADEVDALDRAVGVAPAAPVPPPPGPHAPHAAKAPRTCLVVYQGHYPAGSVDGAVAPAVAGDYALVVLRVRPPAVDRVLVTATLPQSAHRPWWRRFL